MMHGRFMRRVLWNSAAIAAIGLVTGCASLEGRGGFAFGIIGDMPYTKVQEAEYTRVIAGLNAAELAFVANTFTVSSARWLPRASFVTTCGWRSATGPLVVSVTGR